MKEEIFKGVWAYIEINPITNEMVATIKAEGHDEFKITYMPGEMTLKKLQRAVSKRLWPQERDVNNAI